jgi:hypothetical protein
MMIRGGEGVKTFAVKTGMEVNLLYISESVVIVLI